MNIVIVLPLTGHSYTETYQPTTDGNRLEIIDLLSLYILFNLVRTIGLDAFILIQFLHNIEEGADGYNVATLNFKVKIFFNKLMPFSIKLFNIAYFEEFAVIQKATNSSKMAIFLKTFY